MLRANRPACSRLIAVLVLTVAGMLVSIQPGAVSIALASDPCESVEGKPPIDDPSPEIGGTITNADSSSAVSGAAVRLYRCDSGSSTLVTSTTSNSSGDYLFDSLSTQQYYYVEVVMSGPLANYSPSAGTNNPSLMLDVGPSHLSVDFEFEQ